MTQSFGKVPSGERLQRILGSPNYSGTSFQNVEPTPVMAPDASFIQLLREFWAARRLTRPARELPVQRTDLCAISGEKFTAVWFGHSSYLLVYRGLRILVDPVFSANASPVRFFGRRFAGTGAYSVDDLPDIDLLLLTHDHYDHLDYKTLRQLKGRVAQIVCPLGVGAHLDYWGVDAPITELDWGERVRPLDGLELIATPGRHFSGRLFRRGQTLWCSFVLQFGDKRVFIGGDSGYDAQFRAIGAAHGPFDVAFLECGQYGHNWPNIHMFPEQTVSAAHNLNAALLFPVHWAKFALANHPWNEPIMRLMAEAQQKGQAVIAPMIGQPYSLGETFRQANWWEF